MSTTLSDLRSDVRTEMKTDPNGKVWSNAQLTDFANQAYLQVQMDGNFGWGVSENGSSSQTFTAGTQEYSMPSDFGRLEFILLSGNKLQPLSFEEAKIRNPNSTQSTPTHYYIRGSSIGFDPVPNSASSATIYYRKILTALSSDSDAISFSDNFAPAMVKYMAYLAWSSPRGNEQYAAARLEDYEREMNRLRAIYLYRDKADFNYYAVNRRTTQNYYSDRIMTY